MTNLVPTGQEVGYGGKLYFMPLSKDTFVHFTLARRAVEILAAGKLLMNPPYKKMGIDAVAAVSTTWGWSTPKVQTTHIKSAPGEGPPMAIVFKTSTMPDTAYVEEVLWHRDVAFSGARLVSASKGASLLRNTPERLPDDQDEVTYDRGLVKTATEQRVARRFIAEQLTKQWLMGIRRTWKQLMKPAISAWPDVFKALDQLDKFVVNLKDQLKYARPGAKRLISPKYVARLDKLFKQLVEDLRDADSSADHWRDVAESSSSLPMGTFKPSEGERMFIRFRDHFDETVAGHVPIRGGWGRSRPRPLTELLDKILKLLREDAAFIRKHDEAYPDAPFKPETAFTDFDLGGMKVVIDDSTVTPAEINQYAKLFIEARQVLKQKGFGKAWYGDIFVKCKDCGGTSQYDKSKGVGGHFHIGPNTISIYSRPSRFIVELVVHELGHRWWFKNVTRANRLRFNDWIGSGLVPVTVYGGKHSQEAFAEVFMHYILDRKMTSQQVETFKLVALGGRFAAQRVADRWLQAAYPMVPTPGVETRPTPDHGDGLFATKDFRRGQTISQMTGAIVSEEDTPNFQVGANTWMGSMGPALDSVNHSCGEPNCAALVEQPGRPVIAIEDISAGDEIMADYSVTSTDPSDGPFACRCRSATCRGRGAGGWHTIPADQQQRYLALGIVPSYVA